MKLGFWLWPESYNINPDNPEKGQSKGFYWLKWNFIRGGKK